MFINHILYLLLTDIYLSLLTVSGSSDTIQLNNKKNKKHFEKCWAHAPLRAATVAATLPFTRCRYCRTPPAHRCPQRRRRQQQRQRVTEGTAMAPKNGPKTTTIHSETA